MKDQGGHYGTGMSEDEYFDPFFKGLAVDEDGTTISEAWKEIDGSCDQYVSNFGRIRGRAGGVLKPLWISLHKTKKDSGYRNVAILWERKGYPVRALIHRLVALAFIPNPENKRCVNHKDHTRNHNAIWNLEWMTHSENKIYAKRNPVYRQERKVLQMTLDGTPMVCHFSIKDAAEFVGKTRPTINWACQGKYKQGHGYKWAYIN